MTSTCHRRKAVREIMNNAVVENRTLKHETGFRIRKRNAMEIPISYSIMLVIPLYIMVCMDVWSKIIPLLVYLTAGTRRTKPIHTHDRYTCFTFTQRSPM